MTEPEIILTRGISGSGKSTWAKEWVAEDPDNRARVCRDDIRMQLFGSITGVDEEAVTKVEEEMVRALIRSGKSVVIDSTHIQKRFINKWVAYAPTVTVRNFPCPLDVAISNVTSRALLGGNDVPVSVIYSQAKRLKADPETGEFADYQPRGYTIKPAPEASMDRPWAIIVDTDGTVAANMVNRSPYDYAKAINDPVIENVAEFVRLVDDTDCAIIGVSGRPDEWYAETIFWWASQVGVTPVEFYMRATGDGRPDWQVKSDIFDEHIAGRYNILGVFDDRPRVAEMWRQKGLFTFQVGDVYDNF